MDLEGLKKSIIDAVKESQLKLGYSREHVRLYYPDYALEAILGQAPDADAIAAFRDYVCAELGDVRFTEDMGRFCITVPPQGAEYIHKNIPDSAFLKAFYDCIMRPGCSLDDLKTVFSAFSENVVCEEQRDDEDTEYILYFADDQPDAYRYCIHFELGRATCHRFTKKEYERLWRKENGEV